MHPSLTSVALCIYVKPTVKVYHQLFAPTFCCLSDSVFSPPVRLTFLASLTEPVALAVCVVLQALLHQEVLNLDAVEDLLGKRPFTNDALQNIDRYR